MGGTPKVRKGDGQIRSYEFVLQAWKKGKDMKETLKFKLDAIPERFGGGYKAKMTARKRKWASGPARLSGQVSTSPLPTYLQSTKKLGR